MNDIKSKLASRHILTCEAPLCQIDEVSRNATWREHLKKELKRSTVATEYHLPDPRLSE
jgi:hypothetical protein